MGGVENGTAKFRVHCGLHHRLFRDRALGVGVDASKAGYGDWTDGSGDLDLGDAAWLRTGQVVRGHVP